MKGEKLMKVYKVKDGKGNQYLYNSDNIFQLCWAWEHAAKMANYQITEQKTPLGSIYSLDSNTNWILKHFGQTNFKSQEHIVDGLFINQGAEVAINKLATLRHQTKRYLQIYFDKLEKANQQNASALKNMDRWVTGAKVVRDTSATIVVVGTSVISMPATAAAALLTAGSGVKAYAKYTDTGNVGAAGVEFVCEMGVGLIGVGVKAAGAAVSTAEQVCVVLFAKMPAEAAKCAASGDSISQSAAATLTTGVLSFAGEGVTNLLKKIPIPVAFQETFKKESVQESLETLKGVVENWIEDKAKDQAKSMVSGKGSNKDVDFEKLKASHINSHNGGADEEFVRKYCISRI